MSEQKLTRRSALQLAGLGAGSLLAAGRPEKLHAQAAADVDKAIQWAKTKLPNSTPDLISAAAKEGKLTLMMQTSGNDETMTAMIKKFNEHYPFIDVAHTLQTTGQVQNRFNAELRSKNGISDYLTFPSNLKETNNYISSGAIAKFVISDDAAFPDIAKQSGLWYPLISDRAVTAYRVGALSSEEKQLVRTYKELGDPRFKGRLGMNGITNAVASTAAYVLLNQNDQSLWQGLAANKPRIKPTSPTLIDGLLSGEYDITIFGSYASAATLAQNGAPIEFGNTALTPTVFLPAGVSALAPHPNAAKLWQDWFMSKEGQDLWVKLVGIVSARSDVAVPWAKQQPWFFEDPPTHKPIDWADFVQKEPQIVERFKKDFQSG